ncbi:hypothetical protein Q3G72_020785 [Acer saccharum]|nr:hypothetical protein Q3G72_020785 [Acer saccharum]
MCQMSLQNQLRTEWQDLQKQNSQLAQRYRNSWKQLVSFKLKLLVLGHMLRCRDGLLREIKSETDERYQSKLRGRRSTTGGLFLRERRNNAVKDEDELMKEVEKDHLLKGPLDKQLRR